MNAKEAAELLERMKSCDILHGNEELVLRALRLQAAAEANDGTTPETDILIEAVGLDPTCPNAEYFRRLERERNGLAARVGELRAQLADITAAHHAFLSGNRPDAIDDDIDHLVANMDDAARSKP